MNIINSRNNNQVKEAKKLKNRKYRDQNNRFLIEGFRFVDEALMSQFEISAIFIDEAVSEKWLNHIENCSIRDSVMEKVYCLKKDVFSSISSTENSQGVAAVVENKELEVKETSGFYVLADKIQDPGNMGTIIRSAHASGALGIITTRGTVDVYNEKTLRATMGSVFHVPVIHDFKLEYTEELRKRGFELITSTLDSDKSFYDCNLSNNLIIAVGNEGNGLSSDVRAISDVNVQIPMPGGAESLNVSIAASIMMFEVVRQRLK